MHAVHGAQDERAESQSENARGIFEQAAGAATQRIGTKASFDGSFHRRCRGQPTA